VTNEINKQIAMNRIGRMFAVVQVCGKQFKVTENDIIIIEGYWPPNIGDRLKLEKVLLVGSTDFTLVGRPILNRELVTIDATVIEKTLSHTKTRFRFRPRKQFRRINCKTLKLIFFHFFLFCSFSVNIMNILLVSLQSTTYNATN
jgi:large subunit ribosomal protein L21